MSRRWLVSAVAGLAAIFQGCASVIDAENPLRHPPLVERIEHPVAVHFPEAFRGYAGKRHVMRAYEVGDVRLGPASIDMLRLCLEAQFAAVEELPAMGATPARAALIFVPHVSSFRFDNDVAQVPSGRYGTSVGDAWQVSLAFRIDLYDAAWRPIGSLPASAHHLSRARALSGVEPREIIGAALREAARDFLQRVSGSRDVHKALLAEREFLDWEAGQSIGPAGTGQAGAVPRADENVLNCVSGGKRAWVPASRCD